MTAETELAFHNEKHAAHDTLAEERWSGHREKHDAEKELSQQKWDSHTEQHASIARNLTEYKAQSNEWRGSLADLRATFVSNTEVKSLMGQAEGTHEGLLNKIDALDSQIERRFTELSKRIDTEREERRDQQNLRVGQQEGISRTAAIAVSALGVIGTLFGALAILLNILKPPG